MRESVLRSSTICFVSSSPVHDVLRRGGVRLQRLRARVYLSYALLVLLYLPGYGLGALGLLRELAAHALCALAAVLDAVAQDGGLGLRL